MAYTPFLSFIILLLSTLNAWALESDRNQSVLVEADEVEIDFTNGKRIYTGNVSVRQGTIRIIADQIELFYDGEQLDHAVATGNPAVFRQRPDGKEHDVVGTGQTIELDEVNNIVTFITRAQLRQDRDAIEGEKIVYDMGRDRMIVRGGDEAPTRTTRAGEDATTALKTKDNERPKMVLQPESSQSQNIAPRTDSPDVATRNDTQIGFIGNNGAPVFSKRSVTSTSLGTLPKGTAIRVLRSTDGWAEISSSRAVQVWVYGKFVSTSSGVGTATGSNVRIRSTPSTGEDSVILGELNTGQQVRVLATKGSWKKIEAPESIKVWTPSSRLEFSDDMERWSKDWRAQTQSSSH